MPPRLFAGASLQNMRGISCQIPIPIMTNLKPLEDAAVERARVPVPAIDGQRRRDGWLDLQLDGREQRFVADHNVGIVR